MRNPKGGEPRTVGSESSRREASARRGKRPRGHTEEEVIGIEVLIPIFGVMVVLVPIIGITTILTIRLGGKPLIETLARELRASGYGTPAERDHRLADLSEQVETLAAEVRRLREAQDFDDRLLEAKDSVHGG